MNKENYALKLVDEIILGLVYVTKNNNNNKNLLTS